MFRQMLFPRIQSKLIRFGLMPVLVCLVAIVAIPHYIRARTTASVDSCLFNRMWIESAKGKWAVEKKKSSSDIPSESELLEYMRKVAPMWCGVKFADTKVPGRIPTCYFYNSNYIIGSVGERIQCNAIPDHQWDDQSYRRHYALDSK